MVGDLPNLRPSTGASSGLALEQADVNQRLRETEHVAQAIATANVVLRDNTVDYLAHAAGKFKNRWTRAPRC
jgi:hypothetical protein